MVPTRRFTPECDKLAHGRNLTGCSYTSLSKKAEKSLLCLASDVSPLWTSHARHPGQRYHSPPLHLLDQEQRGGIRISSIQTPCFLHDPHMRSHAFFQVPPRHSICMALVKSGHIWRFLQVLCAYRLQACDYRILRVSHNDQSRCLSSLHITSTEHLNLALEQSIFSKVLASLKVIPTRPIFLRQSR